MKDHRRPLNLLPLRLFESGSFFISTLQFDSERQLQRACEIGISSPAGADIEQVVQAGYLISRVQRHVDTSFLEDGLVPEG